MTEAIRKQSVASNHADSSFEFYVADDGASTTNWLTSDPVCRELYIDDVRFSNSLTTEVNILAPGNIGHIVRNRTFDSTYPSMATDVWFHYDQVGSVLCSTDASGALISQIQQDTFGNTQSSWSTGQWGGTKSGWHHNSKEYDGDVDLVYMYQRWYLPETGTFLSKAPMARWREAAYGFARQNPVIVWDLLGMEPAFVGGPWNRNEWHPPDVPTYNPGDPGLPDDWDRDNINNRVDPDPANPDSPVPRHSNFPYDPAWICDKTGRNQALAVLGATATVISFPEGGPVLAWIAYLTGGTAVIGGLINNW